MTIMNWKRLSFVALVGLIACVLWLALNESILGTGPVSIAIQILAALLMVWARITFGLRSFHATANPTAGGLVRTGPYRYLRHPIYAAVLYFLWAGIAVHPYILSVLMGLIATGMTAVRIAAEETLLLPVYPQYREYSRVTSRVIPFVL